MKPILSIKEGLLIVFLLLAHQFSWAADSSITVNESRQVSANEKIFIEVTSGKVRIRVSDSNTFGVTGVLDEQAEGFELSSANGFTRFEVQMPRNTRRTGSFNSRNSTDLEIVVPLNSTVEFRGVNTSIDIAGVQGGSTISTVNGPITAIDLSNHVELKTVNGGIGSSRLSGRIEITTVNGSIDDSGSTGRATYHAVNGQINVNGFMDEVSLSVVNGRVVALLQQANIVELSSVNGIMEMTLVDSLTPRITGSSVSGNITLNLNPAINARFSVRNNVGGGITNRLSSDEAVRANYGPSRRLEFSTGDGTGTVELTTLSGRVELNRN